MTVAGICFTELPPLARGRVSLDADVPARDGITPACAGKRTGTRPLIRSHRNYPRLRGEESYSPPATYARWELPPLARGRAASPFPCSPLPGITPACAGKSPSAVSVSRVARNYPRLRGEEARWWGTALAGPELPPLARGTDLRAAPPARGHGITPARAGNRSARRAARPRPWNYPRSRGEQRMASTSLVCPWELPPLARGTVERT